MSALFGRKSAAGSDKWNDCWVDQPASALDQRSLNPNTPVYGQGGGPGIRYGDRTRDGNDWGIQHATGNEPQVFPCISKPRSSPSCKWNLKSTCFGPCPSSSGGHSFLSYTYHPNSNCFPSSSHNIAMGKRVVQVAKGAGSSVAFGWKRGFLCFQGVIASLKLTCLAPKRWMVGICNCFLLDPFGANFGLFF